MVSVLWTLNLTVPIDRDEDCSVLSNFSEYIQYNHILSYCWSARHWGQMDFSDVLSVRYQIGLYFTRDHNSHSSLRMYTWKSRLSVCCHTSCLQYPAHTVYCMGKLEVTLLLLKKCMKLIYILLELKRLVN